MKFQLHYTIAVFTLITCAVTNGTSAETGRQVAAYSYNQDPGLSLDKRPKYMDTRRDLDILQGLILLSIHQLVDKARLNAANAREDESTKPAAKRDKYMGICMRKQQNNFIPFPCLRNGR
uniref:Pkymdt n=1 Tax=Deroceras reticulatum TaxID=145610 RepID=A0A1X9WEE6_DERRE|nr:pkymdt [Deroceras reticulatum]